MIDNRLILFSLASSLLIKINKKKGAREVRAGFTLKKEVHHEK